MWVALWLEPLRSCTCPEHITVAKGIELSKLFCTNPKLTSRVEGELYPFPVTNQAAVYEEVGERTWGGQSRCLLQSSRLNIQHCSAVSLAHIPFWKCPHNILEKRVCKIVSSDVIRFHSWEFWGDLQSLSLRLWCSTSWSSGQWLNERKKVKVQYP